MTQSATSDIAPPIDFEHLDRFTGGDPVVQAEVFAIFKEQSTTWLRLLEPAADDAAWSSAAHTVKGAARGVGAFALADACEYAEGLVGDASTPVKRSLAAQDVRRLLFQAIEAMSAADQRAAVSSLRTASHSSNS